MTRRPSGDSTTATPESPTTRTGRAAGEDEVAGAALGGRVALDDVTAGSAAPELEDGFPRAEVAPAAGARDREHALRLLHDGDVDRDGRGRREDFCE